MKISLATLLSTISDLISVTAKLDNILQSRDVAREATEGLSANLELQTGKIMQRLDGQLESLSKQLAEKAEENGMVSTLYKRKDAECEEHMKVVTALRETTEKQADQIQHLETSLISLDAAQEENEHTIRRLEEASRDTARLKEELKSKAAAVAELQRTLDAKEREHTLEREKYGSNIHKLAQTIQEKDQHSGAAAQQAAETARREVRAEMESANAETQRLLQETQQQRASLVGQLENLKQQIYRKEQDVFRGAAAIRSLQEGLATEEAKGKLVAGQLAGRSSDLERLQNQMASRVSDLETQVKAAREREIALEEEGHHQRIKFEGLLAGLRNWATQEGLSLDDLDFLSDGRRTAEEIGARLAQALRPVSLSPRPQTLPSEVRQRDPLLRGENPSFFSEDQAPQTGPKNQFGGPLPNGNAGTELGGREEMDGNAMEDVPENDPLPYAATLHHMRRVVVRSPANVPNAPAAPSIDQERARRREGIQPKSILKRVTRSTSNMLKQEETGGVAGNGAFKRSRQDEVDGRSVNTAAGAGEKANRPSKRSRRRSQSEAAWSDSLIGPLETTVHGVKKESSEHGTLGLDDDIVEEQDSAVGRPQENTSNTNGFRGSQPAAARSQRRNSGAGPSGLRRTPSANTPQFLGPRQPNVRTYGSQRAAGEPLIADGSSSSRFKPQSQSRYWTKPKDESQESMTFSQGVGADETQLFAFPA